MVLRSDCEELDFKEISYIVSVPLRELTKTEVVKLKLPSKSRSTIEFFFNVQPFRVRDRSPSRGKFLELPQKVFDSIQMLEVS